MNWKKTLAIVLFVFSFGAISETYRIFTSNAPDIVRSRSSLLPMSIILTMVILYFAIRLWNKSTK